MTPRATAAALVACALFPTGATGRAPVLPQQGPPVRLVAFTNEPREPEFGQVFELRLRLRIDPAVVAFIPDTLLPAEAAVSAGRGNWTSAAGPADSVDVEATYFVMGLMNGGVELPSLEVWTRAAAAGERGGARPARDLEATEPSERAVLDQSIVPIGGALILVHPEMAGRGAAIEPRPPADVLGRDWSVWLLAALTVAAGAAALLAWLLVAARARQRAAGGGPPGVTPRAAALLELDRLLALGWHTDGRIGDFYDATTGVLRRLSEIEEPEWRIALTSTELVGRIEERWGAGAVEQLRSAIWAAECVKFGGRQPGPQTAEQHWSAVRNWIGGLPEN